MPNHLDPVPSDPLEGPIDPFEEEELDDLDLGEPLVRPAWWRWVAIAVIVAMALAGPFAFALYRLLS